MVLQEYFYNNIHNKKKYKNIFNVISILFFLLNETGANHLYLANSTKCCMNLHVQGVRKYCTMGRLKFFLELKYSIKAR